MRADHPSDTKRSRVCLYYTEHLPTIRRDDTPNLKECLVTKITVKCERCFPTCLLYRSPSQNREQFQSFCDSLDILLNNINSLNPVTSIITGDINGKCSKWCSFDTRDHIGKELDSITSSTGYSQIIDKPTHFTNNSSSCIDFLFTSKLSIIVDLGIEKSLYSSCHHNIIYGKIIFRVCLPPPHFRTIWNYKNADASFIQCAIENFNWQYAFGSKTINEKVQVFGEVLMNILSNFVPHKLLNFNYKQPPWMNPKISSSLRKRPKLTKLFYKDPSNSLKELLMSKSSECSNLIITAKEYYQKKMAEKIGNTFTAPKAYWSIHYLAFLTKYRNKYL